MRVYLSRWVCLDVESNLKRLRREAREAVVGGAEWVIFPESFLHGYTQRVHPEEAREVFASVSRDHGDAVFFFGSISESGRNRMTVWRGGEEIARYDKVHLFEPNGECELWTPGDAYACVTLGDRTVGLVNCNDIRFPEQARFLRLEGGADVLVAVAWWPWRRDHVWSTLLRARAVENGVWVLGCSIAASEVPGERFSGAGNHVFDPHGNPVHTPDDGFYELDFENTPPLVVDTAETYADIKTVRKFP